MIAFINDILESERSGEINVTLVKDGIHDVCYTKRQSELVVKVDIIGVLQFHIAHAETMFVCIVATLVEGHTNGKSKPMVLQEVVVTTQFRISGVGLIAIQIFVCSSEEV